MTRTSPSRALNQPTLLIDSLGEDWVFVPTSAGTGTLIEVSDGLCEREWW